MNPSTGLIGRTICTIRRINPNDPNNPNKRINLFDPTDPTITMIDSTESIDPNDLNNDFIDLNDPNNDPNYPKNDSTDQIDLNGDRSNRFDRIIRIQQSSPLDYRLYRPNGENPTFPSNDQRKPTSTSIERTFSSTNCNLHGEPTTQRRRFAPSESSPSAERQSWTTRQT